MRKASSSWNEPSHWELSDPTYAAAREELPPGDGWTTEGQPFRLLTWVPGSQSMALSSLLGPLCRVVMLTGTPRLPSPSWKKDAGRQAVHFLTLLEPKS